MTPPEVKSAEHLTSSFWEVLEVLAFVGQFQARYDLLYFFLVKIALEAKVPARWYDLPNFVKPQILRA